jgi:hypothetical protein
MGLIFMGGQAVSQSIFGRRIMRCTRSAASRPKMMHSPGSRRDASSPPSSRRSNSHRHRPPENRGRKKDPPQMSPGEARREVSQWQAEAALQQWLPLAIYTQRTTRRMLKMERPSLRGCGLRLCSSCWPLALSCAPACERGEARCHFPPVCVTSTLLFVARVAATLWSGKGPGSKRSGVQGRRMPRMLRLTYDDKVALFDEHAHLICSAAPMTV